MRSRFLPFMVLFCAVTAQAAPLPISVQKAQITKSGSIAMFFIGNNPTTPVYPNAIASNPTISVNGVPVATQGPFWSSVNHQAPWIAYQLPKAVSATDTVTWSTQAGWVSASQSLAGADSGMIENYAGQLEPGVYGFLSFNLPDNQKTLQVGFNAPGDPWYETCSVKNVIHRSPLSWWGAVTSTQDGFPLTIGKGGIYGGMATMTAWASATGNGVDNKNFPGPTGNWTFIADETTPKTPMVVSMFPQPMFYWPNRIIVTGPTMTPGRLIDGIEYGKRWDWNVSYYDPPSTWNMVLLLGISTPAKNVGPNTLKNFRLFDAGNLPIANAEVSANDNFVRMIQASPGIPASPLRVMEGTAGSDGYSFLISDKHLNPPNSFSYMNKPRRLASDWVINEPTYDRDREIPIYSSRIYDLSTSPLVYSAQQYGRNAAPASGNIPAGGIPIGDATFDPTAFGLDWKWPWAVSVNPTTGKQNVKGSAVVLEFLTGDANGNLIPHNMKSGQQIGFSTMPSIPVVNEAGTGLATEVQNWGHPIWVTGPSSFIVCTNSTLPQAFTFGRASGTVVCNSLAHTSIRNSGPNYPLEVYGSQTRATGSDIWIAVNHCMADSGVRAMAQRLYNSTKRGTKVYVQYSNEILLPNSQFQWALQLASMEGLTQVQAVVQRGAEIHAIFSDVFGDDAQSIVRVFQPFGVFPVQTLQGLQYADAHSIKIDAIAVAAYLNVDNSPTFLKAAASVCADDPRSIANPVNGGDGILMPMAAYIDMFRYWIKYNSTYSGVNGNFAIHLSAINSSKYGTGPNFKYPPPKLIGYECGLGAVIPAGVSKLSAVPRSGLTHDFMYHPEFYNIGQAWCAMMQQGGMSVACIEALSGNRQAGSGIVTADGSYDGRAVNLWGVILWQTQKRGLGLSNKFWATALGGDGISAHDANESPIAQAYADWIVSAYKNTRN